MTTNSKFRTGSKEAPTEPFKRAVTACLRAIARKPELEVTFAAERPGLSPGKARLPEPARKTAQDSPTRLILQRWNDVLMNTPLVSRGPGTELAFSTVDSFIPGVEKTVDRVLSRKMAAS